MWFFITSISCDFTKFSVFPFRLFHVWKIPIWNRWENPCDTIHFLIEPSIHSTDTQDLGLVSSKTFCLHNAKQKSNFGIHSQEMNTKPSACWVEQGIGSRWLVITHFSLLFCSDHDGITITISSQKVILAAKTKCCFLKLKSRYTRRGV